MSQVIRAGRSAVLALGVALLVATPAQAQSEPPVAITGAVTDRTTTTATLNGIVNPKGARTTYFFQYGPSRAYSVTTAVTEVGDSRRRIRVSVPIGGLAPATQYHYRIVAENRQGITRGEDRTFRTEREPLGLSLAATPNPVPYDESTVVHGQLTGTGNAGRQVVLQSNPWPYTGGFVNQGNPLVTDANGAFSFPILSVPVNTQVRVFMPEKPEVTSPIVLLESQVRVISRRKPRRVRRGRRVKFSGVVRPAIDGQRLEVQKLVNGVWERRASMTARHRRSGTSSSFRRRMRVRRSGTFRVFAVVTDGAHASAAGRTFKVKVRPRR